MKTHFTATLRPDVSARVEELAIAGDPAFQTVVRSFWLNNMGLRMVITIADHSGEKEFVTFTSATLEMHKRGFPQQFIHLANTVTLPFIR